MRRPARDALPHDEVRTLALNALFGYFDSDGLGCWRKPGQGLLFNAPAAPYEVKVIADDGAVLHTYDLRDMGKDFGLEIMGRKPD
jgi:hypothetical protein